MDKNEVIPSAEKVKLIYRDTYNFYTKWSKTEITNWDAVIDESHQIEDTYPFELCRKILCEIVNIIEAEFMKKEELHEL